MKATFLLSLLLSSALAAVAQPRLIGTYKTLPGVNNGYLKTAEINVAAKSRSDLDTIQGSTSVLGGETTYNPLNKVYYCYTTQGIRAVDSQGRVINAIVPLANVNNIEYNINTGKLMGVHRLANNKLLFATVDPGTGAVTDFDTIGPNVSQGCAAFDPYNSFYYLTTVAGILKIDAVAGIVIDTLPTGANTGISNFEYDPVTDRLIGLRRTPDNKIIFCAIDAISHTFTDYDTVRGSAHIVFSENSFDPVTRTYFGEADSAAVIVVNAGTGLVTDTISVKRPFYLYGMEVAYRLPYYSMSLQPLSQTVNTGSNVRFSVATSAPSPSYQWQVSTSTGFQPIANGGQYSGATSAALALTGVTPADGRYYRCLMTSGGFTWPSKIARLGVSTAGVGVSGVAHTNPFTIAPNPVTNRIIIGTSVNKDGVVYGIYTQSGAHVLSGQLHGAQTAVDLDNLPDGIYMLEIGNEKKQRFKVLKQ